jgi:citrate synthase
MTFKSQARELAQVHPGVTSIIQQFPKDAHPMAVLSTAVSSLSGFYSETDPLKLTAQLMGQLKTMAAQFYRHSQGSELISSSKNRDFCDDFLAMMFGENDVNPVVAKALDILFILHADHEQNCSAATVRFVGSSKVNLFASISSGINALWGPLHGGANQAVIEMLEAIKADGGDHKKYLEKAKDKADPFKLMGFGHRVYKNFDPRARIIKKACDDILEQLGVNDPILDIAKGLEEEALNDPYFVERKLYPNVDFYSGIIYRALGIPANMFTVMFAIGRLPGWIAQWKEMTEDSATRIGRPRQIYTGETLRSY